MIFFLNKKMCVFVYYESAVDRLVCQVMCIRIICPRTPVSIAHVQG